MKEEKLIELAKKARKYAHTPYSKFPVGAAILTKEGEVFTGSNIENLSSGLSLCAEKVVLVKALSSGYRNFKELAVVADSQKFSYPCGSCRQALYEFSPNLKILMANLKGEIKKVFLKELLPSAFVR